MKYIVAFFILYLILSYYDMPDAGIYCLIPVAFIIAYWIFQAIGRKQVQTFIKNLAALAFTLCIIFNYFQMVDFSVYCMLIMGSIMAYYMFKTIFINQDDQLYPDHNYHNNSSHQPTQSHTYTYTIHPNNKTTTSTNR